MYPFIFALKKDQRKFMLLLFLLSALGAVQIFCLMQCYSPLGTGLSPPNTLLLIILPMLVNLFLKQFFVLRTNSLPCCCTEPEAKKSSNYTGNEYTYLECFYLRFLRIKSLKIKPKDSSLEYCKSSYCYDFCD